MDVKEAEEKITIALDKAIADGWAIVNDTWGSLASKQCCALGALALSKSPANEIEFIAFVQELIPSFKEGSQEENRSNAWGIVGGFSGPEGTKRNDIWFDLGMRLYEKYKPIKVKDWP